MMTKFRGLTEHAGERVCLGETSVTRTASGEVDHGDLFRSFVPMPLSLSLTLWFSSDLALEFCMKKGTGVSDPMAQRTSFFFASH